MAACLAFPVAHPWYPLKINIFFTPLHVHCRKILQNYLHWENVISLQHHTLFCSFRFICQKYSLRYDSLPMTLRKGLWGTSGVLRSLCNFPGSYWLQRDGRCCTACVHGHTPTLGLSDAESKIHHAVTIKYDYLICSEFDYNFRFKKSFIMIYNNNIYSVYPSISIIIITFQIQNQCDSKPFVHAYVQVPWTEFTILQLYVVWTYT